MYQQRLPEAFVVPSATELNDFREGLRPVAAWLQRRASRDVFPGDLATAYLREAGYRWHWVDQRYLVLQERPPSRGRELFIFDVDAPRDVLLEVPAPLDEWGTYEAGIHLMQTLGIRGLAASGTGRRTNRDGTSDLLHHRRSFLGVAQRVFPSWGILQVRGLPGSSGESDVPQASSLYINRGVPRHLDLKPLAALLENVEVHWSAFPAENVLRDTTRRGVAEVFLTAADRRRLLQQRLLAEGETAPLNVTREPIRPWLQKKRDAIAPQGSDAYRVARLEELMFLDEEILRPLLTALARGSTWESLPRDARQQIIATRHAAAGIGYTIDVFRDPYTQGEFVALHESAPAQRHWGTFVFRLGLPSPLMIEVPRPLLETHAFDFGVDLLQRLNASMFFVAGAHPLANLDGTADLMRLSNKVNAYNLMRQAALRELGGRPMLVVQTRAIRAPVNADVVLATDDGGGRNDLRGPKAMLADTLEATGLRLAMVDGSAETAGYEMGILLTGSSLNHTQNKHMVTLWLSPNLRSRFRHLDDHRTLLSSFHQLNLPTVRDDLGTFLLQQYPQAASQPISRFPSRLFDDVCRYLDNNDIVRLAHIRRNYPEVALTRVDDATTDQAFLVLGDHRGGAPWIANLTGSLHKKDDRQTYRRLDGETILQFLQSRKTWLLPRGWERAFDAVSQGALP